jgi:DNA-binding MarR family transcriptional regulator
MVKLTAPGLMFSELVIEVFRLNGLTLTAGEVLSNPSGLTSARWQVLGVVDHEPAPVSNVARAMGLTRQTVQLTADALERDGMIEYLDNPHHRRAKLIAITEPGRRALRDVEARQAVWANRLARRLDAATLRSTLGGMRQIRAILEQDAAEPTTRKV